MWVSDINATVQTLNLRTVVWVGEELVVRGATKNTWHGTFVLELFENQTNALPLFPAATPCKHI